MDTQMQSWQLGFIHSGRYNYDNGTLRNQSSFGDYWSHTPNDKTSAYFLHFLSTYLYLSYSFDRGYGMSLRCLAASEIL